MTRLALLAGIGLAACGGAAPPPASPAAGPTATEASTGPATAPGTATTTARGTSTPTDAPPDLPTACADASSAACTPPSEYVDRLCPRPHQDLALALLARGTPFTRLYLRGKLDELAV